MKPIMPTYVFWRNRQLELEAGLVLAGNLLLDLPKDTKLKRRHERRIEGIIGHLLELVQSGTLPEDAELFGWPHGSKAEDKVDIDDDAVLAAWAKQRLLINVRIESHDYDRYLVTRKSAMN